MHVHQRLVDGDTDAVVRMLRAELGRGHSRRRRCRGRLATTRASPRGHGCTLFLGRSAHDGPMLSNRPETVRPTVLKHRNRAPLHDAGSRRRVAPQS